MGRQPKQPDRRQLMKLLVGLCLRRGLSQSALASRLAKPQSFVSKYETGERRLDIIELITVSRALGHDPVSLMQTLAHGEQATILDEWDIDASALTSILVENPGLRGMLMGHVAERKLQMMVREVPGVSLLAKPDDHNRMRKGDLHIAYKGKEFRIESKSLQTNTISYSSEEGVWRGKAQVDASDRRSVLLENGQSLQTTLLKRGEFDILAVNCFAFGNGWRFVFAKNEDLPTSSYAQYPEEVRNQLIASLVSIEYPPRLPFVADIHELLDAMISLS